jgi:hypothetical protein
MYILVPSSLNQLTNGALCCATTDLLTPEYVAVDKFQAVDKLY